MNPESTSFDVGGVLHSADMTLKTTRIERLREFARTRQIHGPVELGRAIGKPVNQASDLLAGRASFGEKVARSIEEFAGLPPGWLDVPAGPLPVWPFSDELLEAVLQLDSTGTTRLENVMRAHLELPPLAGRPELRRVHTPPEPPLQHPAPPSVQQVLPSYKTKPDGRKNGGH